jgi:hypothetical protein
MSSALRTIAVGGFAGFVTAIAVATAVQPDAYDSTRDLISGLAGQGAAHPWIMMAGFQLAAVGLGAAAIGIWQRFRRRSGRAAAILVMIEAGAMSVAGFARFDCSLADTACDARLAQGVSTSAAIHGLSALFVFLPSIIATFLLAVAAGDTRIGTLRLRWVALVSGVVGLALILAVEEAATPFAGLLQRIDVLPAFLFPVLAAFAVGGRREHRVADWFTSPAPPETSRLATPALRDYPTARR